MVPLNRLVLIGKIGKAYGIKGWTNLFSFTEKKEHIFDYLPWFFLKDKTWNTIYLKNWKKHKNHFIVCIKNISDRSKASQLTNINIMTDKNRLPLLKKDNYYWNDIIDSKVFNTEKIYLGNVIKLTRTFYNDFLIIQKINTLFNQKEIIIPIVYKKIIKNIDIKKKIIIVQWNA